MSILNRNILQAEPHIKEKVQRLQDTIGRLEKNFSKGKSEFVDKDFKVDYRSELNDEQLKAVQTISGKTLLIAGAGSGKTKTLVYRSSFLLENGVSANNILIVTFTKKAAQEIKNRIVSLLSANKASSITTGTFHSFCNMILAQYSNLIGINPRFTILDRKDSEDLVGLLKKEMKWHKLREQPIPRDSLVYEVISVSRNKRISIPAMISASYPNIEHYKEAIVKLAAGYHNYKRKSNLYDYDDLIDETINHLKDNPTFREKLKSRFKHIMVDEYQDTNIPQKQIIDLIADSDDISLMVVGDDNQSIYSFRGANYENILMFGDTYKDASLIKLEQNYRSSNSILGFINQISDNISLGYKKSLFTEYRENQLRPQFVTLLSDLMEAEFVADEIIRRNSVNRLKFSDIAILCRSIYTSNLIQAKFLERKISFNVVGGIKFVEKIEIKDMIAYLKIIWNPVDPIAWHRVLTIIEGIGNVTAGKIISTLNGNDAGIHSLKDSKYAKKYPEIKRLADMLIATQYIENLTSLLDKVEEYYLPLLKNRDTDWTVRAENIKVLKRLAVETSNLENFLSNLSLEPPNDTNALFVRNDSEKDVVTISTIHSAKGLEWNTVFVISMLDGIIPYYKSLGNYEQLEEERKLFYVACSRAKNSLILTSPEYLSTYSAYFNRTSRFILEISKEKYSYRKINGHF